VSRPPAEEYRARLEARHATHAILTRSDARIATARLAAFAAAVVVLWLAWNGWLSGWWVIVPLCVFLALVQWHDRIIRARNAAARAITFYERGLARIGDTWAGTGDRGEEFRDDDHPYANDLDLFGAGSLFELLSLARTRSGRETLARWLKTPADDLPVRQDGVRELALELDLREHVALAGEGARASLESSALVEWATRPTRLHPPPLRWGFLGLTALTLATGTWWAVGGPSAPLVVALAAQSLAALTLRRTIDAVLHGADAPARELQVLLQVIERVEQHQFRSARLSTLASSFSADDVRASTAIRRLKRLVEMHDWEHNLAFTLVAAVLLWGTHIAWTIEAWRRTYGGRVSDWLAAAGELEALLSLAAYCYEHPEDPFPEIVVEPEAMHGGRPRATFDGTSLGHPLLPAARMVRNDVRVSGDTRLLVVSGSNMSGKSTLLRTVGINAVLALSGAPVRAASLRLSPLAVGATLRIQDSLQEGRSRFYAEITRIRMLAERASGSRPLLFLLDELFHGTNSHDRLVGARGVLQSLLERGAIGLVTTHDLALTEIARELAPTVVNTHFDDWFDRGEIRFDYRMKPGPVTRSNALALMRAVGLDVPTDSTSGGP
jgi:hypothetical protein